MAASLLGTQLLARASDGVHVYRYVPASPGGGAGSTWIDLTPNTFGFFSDSPNWTVPQGYRTLQTAQLDQQTGVKSFVIGRAGTGLSVIQFIPDSATMGHWMLYANGTGPFPDADGWNQPDKYLTIQLAHIDATPGPQALLGRSADGMVAYRFDLTTGAWNGPIAAGQPMLADDPWATDPSYYTTIKTANVDGNANGQVALLARGSWGIRTWRFDATTQTWARYLPYGGYPAVDQTAFNALNTFLSIENGTIRTVFTNPANSPTANQLSDYQNDIATTCEGLLSANPPQYQSCTPPPDVGPVPAAAWTAVSNEIIAELYGAGQVIDHFTTLGAINTQLFIDENSEFPSIAADLKLGEETQSTVAQLNYLGLFGSVLSLLGSLVPIPELSTVLNITAGAIGVAQAATPTLSGSQPSQFDQTYAQIQGEIATIQQQTQDALAFHQSYVLGDFGLLSTVGHLVGSQIWTLDPAGALSASRQGFALWVYQSFLPALWDRWAVSAMSTGQDEREDCFWPGPSVGELCVPPGSSVDTFVPTPPDNGLGMASWMAYMDDEGDQLANWDGLLPKQTPCSIQFIPEQVTVCQFTSLGDHGYSDTLTYLRTPVPATCTYNPGQTAWVYGACPLGVSLSELLPPIGAPTSWPFLAIQCAYEEVPDCPSGAEFCEDSFSCRLQQPSAVATGDAQRVGTDAGRVDLTLQVPLEGNLDLRQARVTLARLVREVGGAEELVSGAGGKEVLPGASRDRATFETPAGEVPHIRGTLAIHGGELTVQLDADGGTLDVPQRCDRASLTTPLTTHVVIDDSEHRPAQILSTAPWHCVMDPAGNVRGL
jgi:hypothetical protein